MSDKKAVVFGIDGCPEEVIRKWVIEENKLPNLRKIYEQGVFSTIYSTLPYTTVPAWMSILTGKTPGKLGVFSFYHRSKDDYSSEITRMDWHKWHPVWEILDENKKRSILFNVPSTLPPKNDFDGILISGPIMNPDVTNIAYPKSLNDKLVEEGFQVDFNVALTKNKKEDAETILRLTRKKMELAEKLFKEEKWDLFMFVFYYIDRMEHLLWRYFDKDYIYYEDEPEIGNYIYKFYQLIDEHLGFYMENLPENANLYIISDHGMGPFKIRIDINNWLMEQGFLNLKTEKKRTYNIRSIQSNPLYRPLRKIYRSFFHKISPLKGIRDKVFESAPKDARSYQDVDWDNTKAYSVGLNVIYVNQKGREPQGMIEEGQEYEALLDEITAKLMELKDPDDGKPVVEKVFRGKELYKDAKTHRRPDLLILYRDESYYSSLADEPAPKAETFYHDTSLMPISANHRLNTIFCAYGPDVEKGAQLDNKHIYDIFPTVLHDMNIPLPDDMDGEVMLNIFKEDSDTRKREVKRAEGGKGGDVKGSDLTEEDEEVVFKRLKDLGYI